MLINQVLPILGALSEVYGPVSVIHLDAHIDTWNPDRYYGSVSVQAGVNHGTFFWHAYEAGYIKPHSSIHAGIRTKFSVRPVESQVLVGEQGVLTLFVIRARWTSRTT